MTILKTTEGAQETHPADPENAVPSSPEKSENKNHRNERETTPQSRRGKAEEHQREAFPLKERRNQIRQITLSSKRKNYAGKTAPSRSCSA